MPSKMQEWKALAADRDAYEKAMVSKRGDGQPILMSQEYPGSRLATIGSDGRLTVWLAAGPVDAEALGKWLIAMTYGHEFEVPVAPK